MTSARPTVLAVSDSVQQRETLAIMLDRDFEVVTAAAVESAPAGVPPAAVVLAPTRWEEQLPLLAYRRWPGAVLVLMDAPSALETSVPNAMRASWVTPFAVTPTVAGVVHRSVALAGGALVTGSDFLHLVDATLRRHLRASRLLAQMAEAVVQSSSLHIALRALREEIATIMELLSWLEAGDETADPAPTTVDLGLRLDEAIRARTLRFACRGIEVHWTAPRRFLLRTSPHRAHVLAGCLLAALLGLGPGPLVIESEGPSAFVCKHRDFVSTSQPPLPLALAEWLLMASGCRVQSQPGHWSAHAQEVWP
jgi:hypothetical protein